MTAPTPEENAPNRSTATILPTLLNVPTPEGSLGGPSIEEVAGLCERLRRIDEDRHISVAGDLGIQAAAALESIAAERDAGESVFHVQQQVINEQDTTIAELMAQSTARLQEIHQHRATIERLEGELAGWDEQHAKVLTENNHLRDTLRKYAALCDNCGGRGFTYWYPQPDLQPTKKPCPNGACAALAPGGTK